MATTVVLADDHPVVRQGLRLLLEREGFDVRGEASDGLEAVALVARYHPDIALLDLAMPTLNGVGAAREIALVSPSTRTILLTMHAEEYHVLEALRAGVKGCVAKSQAAEHLLQAIHEVCAGGVYLSAALSGAVVQAYLTKSEPPPDPLTRRERQVLQLVAEGKTSKEIAVVLGIAAKTIETHRTSLIDKLDIHTTAGLTRYAIRRGFVQP